MMVRGNLPAAMQGLVVVPLFGGYDLRRMQGRLWAYDVTGGRYEERDYVAVGSGSLHAGTVVKVGYRTGLSRDDAINLAVRSLWEAADADSATGGPDALRGIYPRWRPSPPRAGSRSATTSSPPGSRHIATEMRTR